MNFEFKNILVRSLSVDYLGVTWEVLNTTLDPYDFQWSIERSESVGGPWDTIGGPFSDRYMFLDSRINLHNRYRSYYYRIKSAKKSDPGNVTYSKAVTNSPEPDLIAQEIRFLEDLLFREFIGRRCWLLPSRTFGMYCPNCMDAGSIGSTYRKLRSNCLTCYDQGYVRGYMNPILVYVQIDPAAKAEQLLQTGKTQQSNTTARMGSFPILKPGDIIVEMENIRWRVVQISTTQRLRSPVHQELTLHELEKSDIEYRIPINEEVALKDLIPSSERNFTLPTNAEGEEEEYIDSMYGDDGDTT